MICPKCRKFYPDGIEACPDCGTQLIALMGEADAPIDEDYDNISNIDVVFGTEDIDGYADLGEMNLDFSSKEEADESEDADGFFFDGEDTEASADDEAYDSDEEYDLSYSDDVSDFEYSDNDDSDDSDDDIRIFAPSLNIPDDDYPTAKQQERELYEEEYEVDFSDGEFEADVEYGEDDTDITDYNDDELFREFEDDAEYYDRSEETHEAKGQYYRTFKQEEELRNKKNMNMLTALIFTLAVALVIASVVCFVLGSTTELTEMNVENMLFGSLLL